MELSVYCDGGARGNPGPAAIGVVVKNENKEVLCAIGKKIGFATNNVAEYTALIEALSWISRETYSEKPKIIFFLDSELVVSQLNGVYKIKNAKLRELLMVIREKEARIGWELTYKHIPRERNWEADRLVNLALDAKS